MIELLLFLGLFGSTALAAGSGGSDNDESDDDVDLSKYFNNDLFKPGNHLTHTRNWENSSIGDYIKHTVDIEIDD